MSEIHDLREPAWFAQWPRYFVQTLEVYAVFAIDLSGIILSWQPGVEAVFGYKREEFIGQPASIIFTEVDKQAGVPERELQTALPAPWSRQRRTLACTCRRSTLLGFRRDDRHAR